MQKVEKLLKTVKVWEIICEKKSFEHYFKLSLELSWLYTFQLNILYFLLLFSRPSLVQYNLESGSALSVSPNTTYSQGVLLVLAPIQLIV